ncbi:MAG: anaerobic ribonucleoside-triphosphate reductase activating protein [Bacteroidales bacterium]|nr:anaerobic ribonucleoside-triphosphate reductase activating protein [Bacteroidales bacterium]
MLKYFNYDIVFQEIPDEITLAINLTNCPNRCDGCHSPYLQKDIGEIVTEETLSRLLEGYSSCITCFCFMGGDNSPEEVNYFARFIRNQYNLKTAWYSGLKLIHNEIKLENFDYIKIGPYIKFRGGLKSKTTNQKLYKIGDNKELVDITKIFFSK